MYLFKADSTSSQIDAVNSIEHCVDAIGCWMIKQKLCCNDNKTEFIIIGTRQQLTKVSIASLCLGDANIAMMTLIKNIGSWFDENMTKVTHINKLCKTASFHLYKIRRIRKYLTSEASQSSLIMPLLWVA